MGNVLILFYPEKIFTKFLSDKEDIEAVMTHFFRTDIYREVDRGTMTYAEVLEEIKGKLPDRLHSLLKELFVYKGIGVYS